jgi:hypothetical protein
MTAARQTVLRNVVICILLSMFGEVIGENPARQASFQTAPSRQSVPAANMTAPGSVDGHFCLLARLPGAGQAGKREKQAVAHPLLKMDRLMTKLHEYLTNDAN